MAPKRGYPSFLPSLASAPSAEPSSEPSSLSSATIFKFYIPLALSWIFMAVEGPVCTSAISRREHPVLNTAALLILMSLAMWIESPVIDLLSTSTTLSRNRTNYLELRSFVIWLNVSVALVHALVAFTPLYWLVTESALGLPHEVAAIGRPALMIMLPWSPSIGWRRFLQGVLIRFGKTRYVGLGTGVRVGSVAISTLSLSLFTKLPGVQLAACALIAGVFFEACFIHWASRAAVREHFTNGSPDEVPLGLKKLIAFHSPLTMTTLITLCGTPIIAAALARMPDKVLSLAAFQVGANFIWLLRSFTYALLEVVITLYRDEASARVLRRFCFATGALATATLFVLALTGLDSLFFTSVLGARPEVAAGAHVAFMAGGLLPLIGGMQSYVRGMLTAHHLTVSRLLAVGLAMVVLVSALVLAVVIQANGLITSGVAYSMASAAELGVLAFAWSSGSKKLARSST